MSHKEYLFPVAEVGLGQMGVLRQGRLEYHQHGTMILQAARLLRQRLDPSAPAPTKRSSGKGRSLRRQGSDGKLET